MNATSYEVLSVPEFGSQLLCSGDLDPVYYAMDYAREHVSQEKLCRLLLAYWCFYHLGTAAVMAESKDFWAAMITAAVNAGDPKPWPRGAERRHFRGAQAVSAVKELAARYKTAQDAVAGFVGKPPYTFASVNAAAQRHRGFGEWIGFKIADMAERVLRLPVDFSDCQLTLYKDPRQGAAMIYYKGLQPDAQSLKYNVAPWEYPAEDAEVKLTVDRWVKFFRKRNVYAPPHRDRHVGVQEIETIFCKYKSHAKGHYPLMKDTHEIKRALEAWAPRSPLSKTLLNGVPT